MRWFGKAKPRTVLTVLFTVVVFAILTITMLIVGCIMLALVQTGALAPKRTGDGIPLLITVIALASVVVGTVVGLIVSRIPLEPLNGLIAGMNRLCNGEYGTRIRMGASPIARQLSDSFNTLASELENTEMLRSDFINNFSHEFKTPIVSIRGFAKLLRRGDLPAAQRDEYLDIIVDESTRLADMATNVLNLSKVENQRILTDVTRYNLSEQLRNCVLLLEKKWTQKGLMVTADFAEYGISANEELLKQVWINLLDNAVKFSPEGGEIAVRVSDMGDALLVGVSNQGQRVTDEQQARMFDKFWQGDPSHAAEGTGIGLSVAKRVAELHHGEITVESSDALTTFWVRLPKMG